MIVARTDRKRIAEPRTTPQAAIPLQSEADRRANGGGRKNRTQESAHIAGPKARLAETQRRHTLARWGFATVQPARLAGNEEVYSPQDSAATCGSRKPSHHVAVWRFCDLCRCNPRRLGVCGRLGYLPKRRPTMPSTSLMFSARRPIMAALASDRADCRCRQ